LYEALAAAGIKDRTIVGQDRSASGHLEVAAAGVTIRLAADLYELDFQPSRKERYDLAIAQAEFDRAGGAPPDGGAEFGDAGARGQWSLRLRYYAE
jgi:molybdate-binding protein